MTNSGDGGTGEKVNQKVRKVDQATSEIKQVSSEILDVISVKGEVSEPGPSVSECSGKNADEYFKMHHVWSVSNASDASLSKAMARLKSKLPERGWEIVEYGPNDSRDRTLELTADHPKKMYSVNVEFWESSKNDGSPMLFVNVVSSCYKVPAGFTVDRY